MQFHKVKFNAKCYVVAITDDEENVITAGAFTNKNDAEAAIDIAYTLAAKSGLVEAEEVGGAPQMKLDDLLRIMEESK